MRFFGRTVSLNMLYAGFILLSQCVILLLSKAQIADMVTSKQISSNFDTIFWIIFFEIILFAIWVIFNAFEREKDKQEVPTIKAVDDKKRQFEVLLAQYQQLWIEIREYSKEMWQMPSVVGVINSLILPTAITLSTNKTTDFQPLVFPLLATSFLLTLTLTIALHKHQFFQRKAISERERIEKFLIENYGAEKIVWGTKNVHKAIARGEIFVEYTGWWTHRIAFKWLTLSMYAVLVLIAIISFALLPNYIG